MAVFVLAKAKKRSLEYDEIMKKYEDKEGWIFDLFVEIEHFKIHLEKYPPEITTKITLLIFINLGLISFLHKLVPYLMDYNVV